MKKVQIFFDEEQHKYTDEEGNAYTSVTQLINQVTPQYDAEFWAMYRALDQMSYKLQPDTLTRRIAVNGTFYTLKSLYTGLFKTLKTPKEIRAEWKAITQRSLDRGNKTHNYLEDCVNAFYGEKTENASNDFQMSDVNTLGFKFKISNVFNLENSPLRYSHPTVYDTLHKMIRQGYTIYAEKRVYSYEHKVSGTIDILAVRGKEFWIVDWKTNKDPLKFEPGYYKKKWNATRTEKVKTNQWIKTDERFLSPLHNLKRSKGMGYALQLSIYAYICELWGLKCKGLILYHLREDDDRIYPPKHYMMTYLKSKVELLMDWKLNRQRIHESFK